MRRFVSKSNRSFSGIYSTVAQLFCKRMVNITGTLITTNKSLLDAVYPNFFRVPVAFCRGKGRAERHVITKYLGVKKHTR